MAESRRHFSEIMNTVREVETEEDDEEKARIYKEPMRRNLLDVFDKTIPVEISDERMSVFLRVRPFAPHEAGSEENQGCVEVKNNYMVTAIAPKDSHTYKAQLYGLNKARHTFTFSRVFPESTTQKEFFDSTMLKLVQDFIEGQNCLVFTYGVTNSGKTYTIQGNPHEAGILPRGLDVLFNSISGKQWPGMDLKPSMFCDVVKLSPEEEEREQKVKERTLRLNSSEDHDVMTLLGDDASDQSAINTTAQSDSSCDRKGSMDSPEDLLAALENRVREETAVDVGMQGQIRFSVWVSFAEIYNEQIFDLLEPMPKKKDARRPVLKLSEDRRGSPYIKGLKEVNVTSADEAYKLLTIGQRNLKTACTRLNHCSSRSHCIFNIKIIRVPDKGNPQMARVSMLSLCDLAGSERHSKTHTTGERLKEAGNINTSLLTLGRCIELLRYNQQHKDKENKIIPFRESRLTRLFQNFFCGRGKAAMIVNVSQCASMFDETLTVFKFSAIAKQVVIPPRPVEKAPEPKPKRQRTTKSTTTRASSICWDTSTTPSRQSCVTTESVVEEEGHIDEESDEDSDYIEQLEERVEELENRVRELKRERLAREVEIRKEVCQEMQEQFVKIEDMYSTMLRETRQEEAERFEKKLKLVMEYSKPHLNKRPRLDETAASSSAKKFMVDDDDEWVSSVLLHQEKVKVQEYEASLAELRGRNTELEFQVADLTRKAKELADRAVKAEEAQNKLQQSGEDLGHSLLLETLGRQLQEAKDRLKQQEKEIADLNEMLTDAGVTFHQKEKEISKLKQVIAEDEEKSQQQMQTIRELQSLLEESKAAVEDSEKRLEAKNRSISDMKDQLSCLEVRLKEERKVVSINDALKKCEEELAIAKNRLRHEEEDFQQREKALIHGYTAEINNLKSQMALLKSRNLGKCVATSPMRAATPDKSKSPARTRRRILGGGDRSKGKKRKGVDMEESFRMDLVQQLKDLYAELNQRGSLSAELRQKIQDVRQLAEVLQQQAEGKGEVEVRLEQSQYDLLELQGKFEEISSASSELQRQLSNKKELHTELTDNQSESAELRQKLRIAESSAKDLEARLTAANQQKLSAEASKSEIVTKLKDVNARLEEAEVKKKERESQLEDLHQALKSMTDSNTQLQEQCRGHELVLDTKMEAATEERDGLRERVKMLEEQMDQHKSEAEKAREKNEELETVAAELRAMLNQTSADLQLKSEELKRLAKCAEDTDCSASTNETLLKTALSDANKLLQERTQQCEGLQQQLADHEATIAQLKATLQEFESREAEVKATMERKLEEFACQADRVDSYVKEVESIKAETSAALLASQNSAKKVETLEAELEAKKSEIEGLQAEMSLLKESYKQKIQELQDSNDKLQSTLGEQALAESNELQTKENKLKQLTIKAEAAAKALEEKEKTIAQLQTAAQVAKSSLEEKEKLLAEMTASKENAEEKACELQQQLRTIEEEKNTLVEQGEELQSRATEAEQRLKEVQQGLEELKARHRSTEDALAEKTKTHSEVEKELESTKRILADLRQKESTRLHNLQSLEKAQKEAKRLHEKKLAEAREALESKEREVNELQASLTQLQEETQQSGDQGAKLSEATMEIADLRSKLHMEKALTQKHKDSVETLAEENAELQKKVDSISQELEKLQKEKANLMEEISALKGGVSKMEGAAKETMNKFNKELSEYKSSVETLTAELEKARHTKQDFEASGEKSRDKIVALETRLKELEAGEKRWRESHEMMKLELEKAKTSLAELEQCKSRLEQSLAASQVSGEQNAGMDSEQAQELKFELEAEKSKNKELQKQIKALSSIDVTNDAPGTSRRLRREKIQAESELANARFEVEKLQKQVEKLLNANERGAPVLSPPAAICPICRGVRVKLETGDGRSVDSLIKDLAEKSERLLKVETAYQRCECELLEVKAKLVNTVAELKETQASLQEARHAAETEPKQSLSAQRKGAHSILHAELEKGQEREASQCKENKKIAQLEEELAEKTSQLEQANQREMERHNLSVLKDNSISKEELQHQVAALTSQLEAKEQQLQKKKLRLADLQAELSRAQQQRKIAMEDVKANDQVIQQLKDAMMEQEDTMEKQDAVISHKDEQIKSLTSAAEELSKVKKAYEKDTKLYLAREEEEKKLQCKIQSLEKEVKELDERYKKGEEEKFVWREQRDQMVGQLEVLLKKQADENKALKTQLEEDQRHFEKLLDQERTEKQELKRELKVLQRAKDSILCDLRHSNHQLQGQKPPPPPPAPQLYSFRVNDSDLVDDIDTSGHREVDATPPVAAKSLRKGRKRTSDSAAGGSKSRRKPRVKPQDMSMEVVQETPESPEKGKLPSRLIDLEERATQSPLTRSAKKILRLISPERSCKAVAEQENMPVRSQEETNGKRGRRKASKDEAPPPPPFDCAPYQPMETRKSSRLRERGQTGKKYSVI